MLLKWYLSPTPTPPPLFLISKVENLRAQETTVSLCWLCFPLAHWYVGCHVLVALSNTCNSAVQEWAERACMPLWVMVHPLLKKDWPVTFFLLQQWCVDFVNSSCPVSRKGCTKAACCSGRKPWLSRVTDQKAECTDATSFPWFLADNKHNGVA